MKLGFLRATGINLLYVTMMMLALSRYNHAAEFFVTSVIRDFPMKAGDATYKDFYINAGTNNGLAKGVFVEAVRKMPAYDNINSKLVGDTSVKIARLKVIHSDKNISVARLVKFYEKDTTPITGNDSVMIGDLVQVADHQ
jgi:hypothetical protein